MRLTNLMEFKKEVIEELTGKSEIGERGEGVVIW